MAIGISEDLKQHIAPDKLQYEVEKELEKQMLNLTVQAISERSQCLLYGSDNVKANAAQKKLLRFMGYVNEMYVKTEEVKGAIGDGSVVPDYEVF